MCNPNAIYPSNVPMGSLLSNSFVFFLPKNSITFIFLKYSWQKTEKKERKMLVEVKDNGLSIAFNPFNEFPNLKQNDLKPISN